MSELPYRLAKRAFDVIASSFALVGLSPILAAAAVAIRLDSSGSAIFRQQRSGRGEQPFELLKFRSMERGSAEVTSDKAVTLKVTRVGRFIRRTNIDELPQLVNVLRGDMSIVGPRPALLTQTELLSLRAACGATGVRPGLTGWAQVNSYDGMPVDAKARFDCEYMARASFGFDLMVILRTFAYLAQRPPVY